MQMILAVSGKNSFEIGDSQIINPVQEVKITQGNVFEFWFQKMLPKIGMGANGLFGPKRSPWPRSDPFPEFFFRS